jgi:hypothetical protein
VIKQDLGTAGQTPMGSYVCLGTFKNDGFFVSSHQNGNRTGFILNPLENLALCVGIRTINFIENHTCLAGNCILDQRENGHIGTTGIAKSLNILVRSQLPGCIDFEGFILQGSCCCKGKSGLANARGSVQQDGRSRRWAGEIGCKRPFHLFVTKDLVKCLRSIGFREHCLV